MLRLSFATGTEPGKWFDRFRTYTNHELATADADDAVADLLAGAADLALARLPEGGDPRLDETFHLVRLYEEAPGVAVPKDHILAELGETVQPADIADEIVNYRIPDSGVVDVQAARESLQVVGANVGIVVAPRPLLKVLSKRQVVPLGLADAPGAPTPRTFVALVWSKEDDGDVIQDFVGIARGRTPNSSRMETKKKSAREKSLAKQQRRAGKAAPTAASQGSHKGKKPTRKETLPKRKKGFQRGERR